MAHYTLSPLGVGVGFLFIGVPLIVTAIYPERNSFTRIVFRLWTFLPRVWPMNDDRRWVMFNGVGLVVGGLVFIITSMFYFTK